MRDIYKIISEYSVVLRRYRSEVIFYFSIIALFFLAIIYMSGPTVRNETLSGERHSVEIDKNNYLTYHLSRPDGNIIFLGGGVGRGTADLNLLISYLNANRFQTLAFNTLGISSIKTGDFSLSGYTSPYEKFINNNFSDRDYCLIGYDFTTDIARELLATSLLNLPSAVLLISANGERPQNFDIEKDMRTLLTVPYFPFVRHKATERIYFSNGNKLPSNWKKGWAPIAAEFHLSALYNANRSKTIESIDVPVLVLQGDDDIIAPPKEAQLSLHDQGIDVLKFERISNAGHALISERPDEVAKHVTSFLNRYCR